MTSTSELILALFLKLNLRQVDSCHPLEEIFFLKFVIFFSNLEFDNTEPMVYFKKRSLPGAMYSLLGYFFLLKKSTINCPIIPNNLFFTGPQFSFFSFSLFIANRGDIRLLLKPYKADHHQPHLQRKFSFTHIFSLRPNQTIQTRLPPL